VGWYRSALSDHSFSNSQQPARGPALRGAALQRATRSAHEVSEAVEEYQRQQRTLLRVDHEPHEERQFAAR
jgi:hypothetical protein